MVEATRGECSIACAMSVLNYFWYTNFDKRDSWNMMQVFKHGASRRNQDFILTEEEIALRLAELSFIISVGYSTNKEDRVDYIQNPTGEKYKKFLKTEYHGYVQGDFWVDPNDEFVSIDGKKSELTDTTTSKKLYQNPDIEKIRSADISKEVKSHMGEGTLFVVGVDSYVLHGKKRSADEMLGGHVVVTTGIENGNYIVYDPGPAAGYGVPIPIKQFEDAFLARGEGTFVIVREKE